MVGKSIRYYTSGNTARGFYSLIDSAVQDCRRLFILQGGPGMGISTIITDIGERYRARGYDVEWMHCALDNESVDGVVIPQLKVGVVNASGSGPIELRAIGAIEVFVDMFEGSDVERLTERKQEIVELTKKRQDYRGKAYQLFYEALIVHDEWEDIYIQKMDFAKADQIAEELIRSCFGEIALNKSSQIKRRFLGAATAQGAVDFVPNITEDVGKRYFLKGRAGSGKSTILKKIVAAGQERGLDMEVYHCGFDPQSLDMVLFRELGIVIFDSTLPHEYFPERENDEIVDIYARAIVSGTDEIYAQQIKEISERYRIEIDKAVMALRVAKKMHEELKSIYTPVIDFVKVDQHRERIEGEIDQIMVIHDENKIENER